MDKKQYIECEGLLETLNVLHSYHLTMHNYAVDDATADCIAVVVEAPVADVVEVVRCKNCTYSGYPEDRSVWCARHKKYMPKDGYCSYGKGKE